MLVRGRIDAVFADDRRRLDVVDWKTGRRRARAEAAAAAVQLAVYRLAWAQLTGAPLGGGAGRVPLRRGGPDRRAPVDLLGADQLRELVDAVPVAPG